MCHSSPLVISRVPSPPQLWGVSAQSACAETLLDPAVVAPRRASRRRRCPVLRLSDRCGHLKGWSAALLACAAVTHATRESLLPIARPVRRRFSPDTSTTTLYCTYSLLVTSPPAFSALIKVSVFCLSIAHSAWLEALSNEV